MADAVSDMHVEYIMKRQGFTIVELLIVIVVIGILAAITIVAYNGVQTRAKNAQTQSALSGVAKKIEVYYAENGNYPSTGNLNASLTDDNCPIGSSQANWVPGLTDLPQSSQPYRGVGGGTGCFVYSSDGQYYVVSAWNMVIGGPQKDTMYRRLGFREVGFLGSNLYLCNHVNIGGTASGSYVLTSDFYKHSYTISNITSCNETPPTGA